MISTVDDRPFGSVYVAVSPTFLPLIALPRGDFGEYTSIGDPLSSREASRKVTSSSSPSKRTVTVMPGPTTPSVRGGSPTLAFCRMCWIWLIRASCLPCSSLAAWYPPFSRRSPSSRAASIFFAISMRPCPERWSNSALSRSYASWVNQVTLSSRVSVTGTPQHCAGLVCPLGPVIQGARAYPLPWSRLVSGGNLLRLTRVGHCCVLVK